MLLVKKMLYKLPLLEVAPYILILARATSRRGNLFTPYILILVISLAIMNEFLRNVNLSSLTGLVLGRVVPGGFAPGGLSPGRSR